MPWLPAIKNNLSPRQVAEVYSALVTDYKLPPYLIIDRQEKLFKSKESKMDDVETIITIVVAILAVLGNLTALQRMNHQSPLNPLDSTQAHLSPY